jgi:hypothetical protein
VTEWTVWGNGRAPEYEGEKEAALDYVKDRPDRNDLYLADETGTEWDYNHGTGKLEKI